VVDGWQLSSITIVRRTVKRRAQWLNLHRQDHRHRIIKIGKILRASSFDKHEHVNVKAQAATQRQTRSRRRRERSTEQHLKWVTEHLLPPLPCVGHDANYDFLSSRFVSVIIFQMVKKLLPFKLRG
jgi:hypothetical protein